jgi:hypothetical protein
MKRTPGLAVAAALLYVSLVSVATAHTVSHDSTVTFHVKKNGQEADTFEGRVLSDSDRCVADRLVKIFRVDEGPDHLVTAIVTDADGEYSEAFVGGDVPPNTYRAVVTRKVLRKDEVHKHVCSRAVSTERVVAAPAS